MKISVVLPVYNVELYIDECLDSILKQTFTDFEVIVVDDGSTDKTQSIIKRYKDDRVKYIFQKNSGLSAARNKGIDSASGKYIIFIDSDDIIKPNLFNDCYFEIEKSELDIIFYGFKTFYGNKENRTIGYTSIPSLKGCIDSATGLNELFKDNILHFAWANMVKRSIFVENKVTFPVNRNYEDFSTTYKLIYFSKRIGFLNAVYYFYRQRQNSIMHKAAKKEAIDILIAKDEIIYFVSKNIPKSLKIANVYVLRRLIDAWVFATQTRTKDKIFIDNILKEIIRTYKASEKKYISRKTKIKYYLLRLNILKLMYLIKKRK